MTSRCRITGSGSATSWDGRELNKKESGGAVRFYVVYVRGGGGEVERGERGWAGGECGAAQKELQA